MRVSSSSGVSSRKRSRQEPDVGALLHRHEVHVFELARMRVGPHFLDDLRQHLFEAAFRGSALNSCTLNALTRTPSSSFPPSA